MKLIEIIYTRMNDLLIKLIDKNIGKKYMWS